MIQLVQSGDSVTSAHLSASIKPNFSTVLFGIDDHQLRYMYFLTEYCIFDNCIASATGISCRMDLQFPQAYLAFWLSCWIHSDSAFRTRSYRTFV